MDKLLPNDVMISTKGMTKKLISGKDKKDVTA
jgi:hypothetical protein